ncbi:hypothetical protein HB662_01200 [Roseomonas frigidaquae]|uniref:Uncharacterized protein n=1 Tax=Falsiroseomonas frigidaquae TaxID=487318 RepID=A0ABX1ERW6_9PROT|nr:hypothetical protein [Falsiroseomonas frigidaquae]NKE43376.1 hypothetical protein [Falsiroseomonas frigidaquae]
MGRLVAPAGDPAVTFRRFGGGVVAEAANDADIISSELLAPQDPGAGLPVRRVVVRYARNWTPQTTGINGGVSDARRAWLAEPYRATAPAEDAAVAAKHPLAEDLVIDTLLVHAADAAAERDRQLALRSVRRDRLRIRSRLDADLLAAVDVGAVVRVVQPRWRCDAGRLFVVIGPAIDARISGLDVVVWG